MIDKRIDVQAIWWPGVFVNNPDSELQATAESLLLHAQVLYLVGKLTVGQATGDSRPLILAAIGLCNNPH